MAHSFFAGCCDVLKCRLLLPLGQLHDELYNNAADPSVDRGLGAVGISPVPNSKFNATTGEPFTSASWYNNGVNIPRGGVPTSTYSQPWSVFCQNVFGFEFHTGRREPPNRFPADKVAVLTDGICGSACSLFVKTFKQLGLGKVISVGGIGDGTFPETGSFHGGRVIDPISVISQFQDRIDPPPRRFVWNHIPPNFETSADLTVNWWQNHDYDFPPLPAEFNKVEADFNVEMYAHALLAK